MALLRPPQAADAFLEELLRPPQAAEAFFGEHFYNCTVRPLQCCYFAAGTSTCTGWYSALDLDLQVVRTEFYKYVLRVDA